MTTWPFTRTGFGKCAMRMTCQIRQISGHLRSRKGPGHQGWTHRSFLNAFSEVVKAQDIRDGLTDLF